MPLVPARRWPSTGALVVPLAVALAASTLLVYALSSIRCRSGSPTSSSATRRRSRRWPPAQAEHRPGTGTLTGKDRASTELATFYNDVLPRISRARAG